MSAVEQRAAPRVTEVRNGLGSDDIDPAVHDKRWWVLGVLCLSMTIIVMDNTILNVAIPSLIKDLDATNSQVQWIIDSYTIVFAGLLLTTGSLSDRFGRKGALQVGIVLFMLGSALSALATTATYLIITRAFMGIGGALIMPSTLSLLTNTFRDPKERGRAIAIWAGFSGVGVALGPVIGGLLLQHFSWASVFWVNVPIGTVALISGVFLLPTSKETKTDRLDPLGSILSMLGLGALLYGIIEVPAKGWSNLEVQAGFVVGVLAVIAFITWELRTSHPMLDMRFFKNPRFTAANMAITLTFFAMFGSLFLMAQYWQFVHGYTALQAGIRLIPYAAGMMIVAPMSARVVERIGSKRVMTIGLCTVTVALLLMSLLQRDTPYVIAILPFVLMSAGVGFTMPPATESIMGSLPRDKAGVGSAVNDTTRQMGGAVGVALIGSVVASIFASEVDGLTSRFDISRVQLAEARSSLGSALKVASTLGDQANGFTIGVKDAFVSGLHSGLRLAAGVVVCAAVVVWRYLPARAADHVDAISPSNAEFASIEMETGATLGGAVAAGVVAERAVAESDAISDSVSVGE
ncbi:MAG: MFS transporter [Ilumatobacteraceae bacterium]